MPFSKRSFIRFSPIQILIFGYLIFTFIIAVLLTLPISTVTHHPLSLNDAWFMASSGISTSGLCVVDQGRCLSFFGQMVLLFDFQVGGIGYMAFVVLLWILLGRRASRSSRSIATESISGATLSELSPFFLSVVGYTFIIEAIGAGMLFLCWRHQFSNFDALYFSIFHSISGFCTAGFSLFPDSIMSFQKSVSVNLIIDVISILGGIGFYVLYEVAKYLKKVIKKEYPRKFLIHTKLACWTTLILMLLGMGIIFFGEHWPETFSFQDRMLASSFQSISASTTDGFNSMNTGTMSTVSVFFIILLMLIGASPGSTGGGFKTTTLAVMFIALFSFLRQRNPVFSGREIPYYAIQKAYAVFFAFLFILTADILVLSVTEKASFLPLCFEAASALGNTGLSMGIRASLSAIGKFVLSITMLIGRVGPLALGMGFLIQKTQTNYRFPEGEVLVG